MIQVVLIAGLIFTLTACAQMNPRNEAEVRYNQSNVNPGSWDTDSLTSRNKYE